jgi:hypothetical protein
MAKRPGSLVLTFSKKNIDVKSLLENKKFKNEAFIVTDYICESIRFYEKHKNSIEFNNLETVKKLIDEKLKSFIKINAPVTIGLAEEHQEIVAEKIFINAIKTNMSSLEKDLDNIPIDED